MKLSVIVPVYNEEKTISAILERILEVPLPTGVNKEIVVVDDGSNDGTAQELSKFNNHPSIKIFHQKENQGKTTAVKIGIEKSSGDIILIQDADLEYTPDHYPMLLNPILNGSASVVYGSRFMGGIKGMTFVNRLANRISNLTINFLFGTCITDFHTCFKVFKKEVIKNISITSKNFSFDTEITARLLKKGYSIHEVPINYVARKRTEGKKITWGKALETYFFLLKYRFMNIDR